MPNIALTGVLRITSGAHLLMMWHYDQSNCGESPDRARHESGARKALGDKVLQQVEQTDLMTYGLIPEFVGRFPIITALHVSPLTKLHTAIAIHTAHRSVWQTTTNHIYKLSKHNMSQRSAFSCHASQQHSVVPGDAAVVS